MYSEILVSQTVLSNQCLTTRHLVYTITAHIAIVRGLVTSTKHHINPNLNYTVLKNTHSRFLLYLRGKCFDLYKIFRKCFWGIRHSIEVKIKYSLLLLTCKHFYQMFIFYRETHYLQTCKQSVLRHRQQWIFNFYVGRILNSSQTYPENFV